MDLNKVCKDIRMLKIQGAANIARSALLAFSSTAIRSKAKNKRKFYAELNKARKKLFATRPTEPAMRNYINYVFNNLKQEDLNEIPQMKLFVKQFSKQLIDYRKQEKEKLFIYGSKLIKRNSTIFTHCHSSTVMGILKKSKKHFQVYNTETRPLFQGRKTAKELIQANIPVTHFVDSAARIAIKESDLLLIGADSITPTRVYNKIGSEMYAMIANKYGVPVYICSSAWKFNPLTIKGINEKFEIRASSEIWKNAPKKIKIRNYAFEKIPMDLITGFISELGILSPSLFFREIEKKHPWMFE